jgi:hypothetical protein
MSLTLQLVKRFGCAIFLQIQHALGCCLEEDCMMAQLNFRSPCKHCCHSCGISRMSSRFDAIPCLITEPYVDNYLKRYTFRVIRSFACSQWCADYMSSNVAVYYARTEESSKDAMTRRDLIWKRKPNDIFTVV